jgi:integrase
MRSPFSLIKRETQAGFIWYARYWNEKAGDYTLTRSTGVIAEGKKQRRREAEQKAQAMLAEIHFDEQFADRLFVQYVKNFWKPDSAYVRECATIRKNPLSAAYILTNTGNVRLHIEPFPGFRGITLRELTAGIIRDWQTWTVDQGLSGRRINSVLSTMRVAIHYAVSREELDHDPFQNIGEAVETPKEKGVLSQDEATRLIHAPITDPRSRLAVLLGLLCGMRRGEIRGLQWGDIDNGLIHLTHNFVNADGMKAPKRGSRRTVPYPTAVTEAFKAVRKIAVNPFSKAFVLESIECPGQPMGETFFRNAIRRELDLIGISSGKEATETEPAIPNEQKRRNLTFHSLRHCFVTLGRMAGISDLEIQALAGHTTGRMMEHYSHAGQVLDFSSMRKKLEKVAGV